MVLIAIHKKIIMGIVISTVILLAFYALNESKHNMINNPANYQAYVKYENITHELQTYIADLDTNSVKSVWQNFSGYTGTHALGMYDYTHNNNIAKMDLWLFFALLCTFFCSIMFIYLLVQKRYKDINDVLTLNVCVTAILFVMFAINFDKLFFDIYGHHMTDIMAIISNTIGVYL
jgi:4-amino-4-deoxy-L-arabinose transferase-like glycosyltransferase